MLPNLFIYLLTADKTLRQRTGGVICSPDKASCVLKFPNALYDHCSTEFSEEVT